MMFVLAGIAFVSGSPLFRVGSFAKPSSGYYFSGLVVDVALLRSTGLSRR